MANGFPGPGERVQAAAVACLDALPTDPVARAGELAYLLTAAAELRARVERQIGLLLLGLAPDPGGRPKTCDRQRLARRVRAELGIDRPTAKRLRDQARGHDPTAFEREIDAMWGEASPFGGE
jgi:hypothetical protein